ncbi:MAG: hypothetical protein IT349_19925 [Candidatus Eisenbacteria bacterium]|nr:hypothetical protein [Candidatus Eisenbacteria bacterium]
MEERYARTRCLYSNSQAAEQIRRASPQHQGDWQVRGHALINHRPGELVKEAARVLDREAIRVWILERDIPMTGKGGSSERGLT